MCRSFVDIVANFYAGLEFNLASRFNHTCADPDVTNPQEAITRIGIGINAIMKRTGQVRIIGGQWKHRYIRFPHIRALRPSTDATRETVFNWLRNDLVGSTCLDLYAGSGAFGFEAASRGAKSVVMVEHHRQIIQSLHQTRTLLAAEHIIDICQQDVLHYLQSPTQKSKPQKFDLVFMDAPFKDTNLHTICDSLITHNRLNDDARIYIESQKSNCPLPIPAAWHISRQSRRGMVQATLITTNQPTPQWQK